MKPEQIPEPTVVNVDGAIAVIGFATGSYALDEPEQWMCINDHLVYMDAAFCDVCGTTAGYPFDRKI